MILVDLIQFAPILKVVSTVNVKMDLLVLRRWYSVKHPAMMYLVVIMLTVNLTAMKHIVFAKKDGHLIPTILLQDA